MADKETQTIAPEKVAYKLSYRHRKTIHNVNFLHVGDEASAMAKAISYCKAQKTDFVNVEPLFIDLDMSIKQKTAEVVERIPGRAY